MRPFTTQTNLDANGNATSQWSKNYEDGAGAAYETIYAAGSGTPYGLLTYNNLGQLISESDPDQVATLYLYNGKGELSFTAADLNQNVKGL